MMEVYLRPMTAEMYHAYFREYENDPALYPDGAGFAPYVYDPEKVDRYIQRQIDLKRKCFAVLCDGELAGELILKDIEPRRRATLSICMKNAGYKGRGIGTRAEALAAEYAFNELGVPALFADALRTNARSRHVLEKVGFVETGRDETFVYYCMRK